MLQTLQRMGNSKVIKLHFPLSCDSRELKVSVFLVWKETFQATKLKLANTTSGVRESHAASVSMQKILTKSSLLHNLGFGKWHLCYIVKKTRWCGMAGSTLRSPHAHDRCRNPIPLSPRPTLAHATRVRKATCSQ